MSKDYLIRRVDKSANKGGSKIDCLLEKDGEVIWDIFFETSNRPFLIKTRIGEDVSVKKKWPFLPIFSVYVGAVETYKIKNRTAIVSNNKFTMSRGSFLYLDGDLICTFDFQSKHWNEDKNIAMKFSHNCEQYQDLIAIYALLVYMCGH